MPPGWVAVPAGLVAAGLALAVPVLAVPVLAGLAPAAANSAGSTAVTARTGSTRPRPVPGPVEPRAVASIRATTWASVSFGWAARTSAATPETKAAAKLVPLWAGL